MPKRSFSARGACSCSSKACSPRDRRACALSPWRLSTSTVRRAGSRSSPVPSASPAAGGTATKLGGTTSSPNSADRSPGYTEKTVTGTCMAFLPDYAELHALSNFSFLRAASHPEELVQRAHALGYKALALTDECSLAGSVRAHFAAKECGLRLIHGTEVTVEKSRLVLLA